MKPMVCIPVVLLLIGVLSCDDNPAGQADGNTDRDISVSTDKTTYIVGDTTAILFDTGTTEDTLYVPHCNFEHYGVQVLCRDDTAWTPYWSKICLAYYQSGIMVVKMDTVYTDKVVLPAGTYKCTYAYDVVDQYPSLFVESAVFEVSP